MGCLAVCLGEVIQFASGSRLGEQRRSFKAVVLHWMRMASTCWTSRATAAPIEFCCCAEGISMFSKSCPLKQKGLSLDANGKHMLDFERDHGANALPR